MKTYIYRTTDFGQTWTSIAKDAIKGYAHIIRQDPEFKDLLFVGTEFGLFLTVDGGQQWAQFTGGLPNVSVRDLAIHPRESDLIIATHGRGIYIVDDFSVLRQLTPEVLQSQVAFLKGRDSAIRFPDYRQEANGDSEFVGSNLQEAATISYYLKDRHVFGDLKIEIYDQQGNLVTTLPGGKRKGINRVKWFMRLKPPKVPPAPTLAFGALVGPTVPEGVYRIKLIKDKETYTSEIKLVADPRLKHSPEDRKMQQDLVMKLYRMQERLAFVADTITDLRDQAKDRASKLKKGESTARTLTTFADRLDQLHRTLVATKEGFLTGEEKLRERVVDLYMFVSNYGGRPTNSQIAEAAVLEREIEKANSQFETIIGKELQNINDKLKGKRLEPMRVMTEEEWDKKQT